MRPMLWPPVPMISLAARAELAPHQTRDALPGIAGAAPRRRVAALAWRADGAP